MSDGNDIQKAATLAGVADAAIDRFVARLQPQEPKLPSPVKWGAGIIAALMTAATIGYFAWLTNTVASMQVTLARVDERMALQTTAQDSRFEEMNRRITKLETDAMTKGAGR